MRKWLIGLLLLTMGTVYGAPTPNAAVNVWRDNHGHAAIATYLEFLKLPNTAADRDNIEKNAASIVVMMRARGLNPQLLRLPNEWTPPLVYGELTVPGATRTLVLYAHYDGQPADARGWIDQTPWQPIVRSGSLDDGAKIVSIPPQGRIDPNWRIYARAAADDKLGVFWTLMTLDALREAGLTPTSNLKFVFEGEEESASPHLEALLRAHAALVKSDGWIMLDGPLDPSGRKLVDFGVRGISRTDITVYGPNRPLHSGHYGNWAPNPALMLARLLASMKAEDGRVAVAGFYDDDTPLSALETSALKQIPDDDVAMLHALGLSRAESSGRRCELLMQPSLNIDGMRCADVGPQSRNIIATTATATIDMRLVAGNDWKRQFERLRHHVERQGFFVVEREPTSEERFTHARIAKMVLRDGYNAYRVPMDAPFCKEVCAAVQSTVKDPIVRLPSAGGSLPLVAIHDVVGVPLIGVAIANYDDNQHAENENIRVQSLWDTMDTVAAIMTMP